MPREKRSPDTFFAKHLGHKRLRSVTMNRFNLNIDPMYALDFKDMQQLVLIIAAATDPSKTNSIHERRRTLLTQLAELIEADFWMWSMSQITPENSGEGSTCLSIYGGQINDKELVSSAKAFMEPKHIVFANRSKTESNLFELTFPDQEPENHQNGKHEGLHLTTSNANRLGDSMLYFCKHHETIISAVGIHRRNDKEAFSQRDHALFHLAVPSVSWLHKNITEVYTDPRVTKLSLRTRQVLDLLLAGDSPKEIAMKLNLSTHTVGDYVKKIYHQLGVSSRAELQAYFHTTRQPSKSC